MPPVHVTPAGAIIAFVFLASIISVIVWMMRVPEQTPTTLRVAKAVRQTQRASRVLVPVQGTALSDRMVALGGQMAKARNAALEVFYVIEVPWTLPLNARLPREEQVGQEVVERAQRIADRYGVHLEERITNAREAGPAIVDEATSTGADIILMADIPWRPGELRFSTTTSYVLRYAPSEVIVDRPSFDEVARHHTSIEVDQRG
jgi:nucleotide-binding universal stress UspA family protein